MARSQPPQRPRKGQKRKSDPRQGGGAVHCPAGPSETCPVPERCAVGGCWLRRSGRTWSSLGSYPPDQPYPKYPADD